jgi:nucleoporin NDC1
VSKVIAASVLGTFGYLWIYRGLLWSFWTQVFSPIYSFPNLSYPRVAVPIGFFDIIVKFLVNATLLSFIWEFTNKVFSAFITEQPLKKERPLTDDSKDPNGSLLSGLRGKRPFSRVRKS